MQFNPYKTKQAIQVILSQKRTKPTDVPLSRTTEDYQYKKG